MELGAVAYAFNLTLRGSGSKLSVSWEVYLDHAMSSRTARTVERPSLKNK